jgi:iron complex transport system substrate-binding protein
VRVLSLLPSATEIVCALGEGRSLVGRSEECDYPPEVRALPVVMKARAAFADDSSRAIDQRVGSVRARGEGLYELDLELLNRLRPDLILTQDLCAVCSVTDDEVMSACKAASLSPRILSLRPTRLEEVWSSIQEVAGALGKAEVGDRLASALRLRSRAASARIARRRVAVVEWLDPPFLAGLWTPDIIHAAGGTAVGVAAGQPGSRTTWPLLAELKPDLVVVSPCSFPVLRSLAEMERPELRSEIEIPQPPLGLWVADEAYFSRPGPRLIAGVELIADLIAGAPPRAPMPVERWMPSIEVASS